MQKISTCLWFDNQAEEAAKFYTSLFKKSKIGKKTHYGESGAEVSGQKKGSVMTVDFELEGLKITGLNGGPIFKFTPANSYFVWCDTEKEIESLWKKLSKGGEARIELGTYSWAEKYGWTTDKYGVEWQLMIKSNKSGEQKIAPVILFVDKLFGKGEEALNFYMSLFKKSKVEFMARDEKTDAILHCVFSLAGQNFVLSEGPGEHGYTFSTAFSFVIPCDTQVEIDNYWAKLSKGGTIEQCGWLKDKYGVSWQVVPSMLSEYMQDKNPKRVERVMRAVLEMKKLDIKTIEKAYKQV